MISQPPESVTTLLQGCSAGDAEAGCRLVPLVYGELRKRAAAISHEGRGLPFAHTPRSPGSDAGTRCWSVRYLAHGSVVRPDP